MAMYNFKCHCGRAFRRILGQPMPGAVCPACGALAQRKPQGASTSVYETLDNGLQAKATIRPADAQRIFKEIEIESDLEQGSAPDEEDLENLDFNGEFV